MSLLTASLGAIPVGRRSQTTVHSVCAPPEGLVRHEGTRDRLCHEPHTHAIDCPGTISHDHMRCAARRNVQTRIRAGANELALWRHAAVRCNRIGTPRVHLLYTPPCLIATLGLRS